MDFLEQCDAMWEDYAKIFSRIFRSHEKSVVSNAARATSNSWAFCQAEAFSQALRAALNVHTFGLQTSESENYVNMCQHL